MDNNRNYFAWSYPAQKYDAAIDTLVTHFGPSWERMTFSLMNLTHLKPDHFPDRDLFERTAAVISRATKFGPLEMNGQLDRGSLENTLRRSKRSTFEKLAHQILDIHGEINRRRGSYEEV